MRFVPSYCPNPACASRAGKSFRYARRGTYARACDKRIVQRFRCTRCQRFFSMQTFRVDYRLKRPELHVLLLRDFVSKTTHRQSARTLGCDRKTVHHRLLLLGQHCRDFHESVMARTSSDRVRALGFLIDELETHEESRRLQPVTVPVVVEKRTHFVVGASVGSMPARGNLKPKDRARKAPLELKSGRRRSESRTAVREALQSLSRLLGPRAALMIGSDFKSTYPGLIRRTLGVKAVHSQHASTARRNRANPLFAINHTFAMLRDGVSRLVRRNWGASKRRGNLLQHMWIWIAWRNYVRGITNGSPTVTPAMALGVMAMQLSSRALTLWRPAPAGI